MRLGFGLQVQVLELLVSYRPGGRRTGPRLARLREPRHEQRKPSFVRARALDD